MLRVRQRFISLFYPGIFPMLSISLCCLSLACCLCLAMPGCGKEDGTPNGAAPVRDKASGIPAPPFELPERIDLRQTLHRPSLILFIIIDTLRADHVGAYGCTRGLTPALDRMAQSSYLFDNAYSTCSWTRPSVASMFTSCYPSSIQMEDREDMLPEDLVTLAEMLNVYGGYHCAGISANGNAGAAFGFSQGFEEFIIPTQRHGYPGDEQLVHAEAITSEALKKLPEWYVKSKGKPQFLFLHYVDPHDPYMPHPDLMAGPEPEGRFNGSRKDLQKLDTLPWRERTEADLDRIRFLYNSEIRYCDHWIQKLVEGIFGLGLGLHENMMVLVTSDHGEGLWDHNTRAHGQAPHNEQIHVPLLIRTTRPLQQGPVRIAQPVSLIDLAPTILSFCGIPLPFQFQGHDLRPLMEGKARDPALDLIYSEVNYSRVNYESLSWNEKKTIHNRTPGTNPRQSYQLFDRAGDPGETIDLNQEDAATPWKKDHIQALRTWSDTIKCDDRFSNKIDVESLDEETIENLRALGYL